MTSTERPTSPDPRFAVWIGATVALFLVAVLIGFVWLPSAQRGAEGARSVERHLPRGRLAERERTGFRAGAAQPASMVAWTAATRRQLDAGQTPRAAPRLRRPATTATAPNGISTDAAFPNLAGQSVDAIYKQLEDYRSGKRNPAVMGVFVAPLSEQDSARSCGALCVAAESLCAAPGTIESCRHGRAESDRSRRSDARHRALRGVSWAARLHAWRARTCAASSAPISNSSCRHFKAGNRRNDISEQMRAIARQLTSAEIAMIAAYYSNVANFSER